MTRDRMVSGARKGAGLVLMLTALGGNTARAGAGPPQPLGRPPVHYSCPQVPEVDPGFALSAFTLLAGGLMVVTDRRRAG